MIPDSKKMVKQDIGFLEYPDWVISERQKVKKYTFDKEDGSGTYEMATTADCLPSRFDKIVLYDLLYELFDENKFNALEMTTTRYKVSKNVFPNQKVLGKPQYDRIMLALERWEKINLKFEGIFYEGDSYTTRLFSIIDDVILHKEKKQLYIRFNQQFVKQLRETKYYKFLNIEEYKLLTRPVSARLYEILIKTFKDRQIWKIGIIKLAQKMTLTKIYPSQILEKLKPALNEINKKTELNIKFEYNKASKICTFIKVKSLAKVSDQKGESVNKFLKVLPEALRTQKSVRELLNRYLKEKGGGYVKSNIAYSMENADTNLKVYLKKALKNDWGEEYRSTQAARLNQKAKTQQQRAEERRKQAALERQFSKEHIEYEKQKQYIESLSKEAIKQARQKILLETNYTAQMLKNPTSRMCIHLFIEALENIRS